MGIVRDQVVRISPDNARVRYLVKRCGQFSHPAGETAMYVRRAGKDEEFVMYEPISVVGDYFTFNFDNLLFERGGGRYWGRIVVEGTTCATVQLEYVTRCSAVAVSAPSGGDCGSC